ncbi:uncharacterized protein [Pempheris klunzingeri]|uniref:uncharacterized protein n=1 Tax=Pempheris klunzingeri TaxID=3127111 RepID=UPI00397F8D4D
MFQRVLFIKLLMVHYATQSQPEILANCNEDVPLQCPGADFDNMNFLSVTWYKLKNQAKKGIIRRGKGETTTQYYNTTAAKFGEKYSLLLSSVTAEDSGTYECAISANVRGQNQNLRVDLVVRECVTQPDLTTMTTVLNINPSDLLCPAQVEELPVMWSVIGYMAVGFTKVILSLIIIRVIRAVRSRTSRRRQHTW